MRRREFEPFLLHLELGDGEVGELVQLGSKVAKNVDGIDLEGVGVEYTHSVGLFGRRRVKLVLKRRPSFERLLDVSGDGGSTV